MKATRTPVDEGDCDRIEVEVGEARLATVVGTGRVCDVVVSVSLVDPITSEELGTVTQTLRIPKEASS